MQIFPTHEVAEPLSIALALAHRPTTRTTALAVAALAILRERVIEASTRGDVHPAPAMLTALPALLWELAAAIKCPPPG